MAAITLTPVDSTTLPIVVNTDIIYHVFTINGVTRVFFSKGGKSPYQVDVQESAASIAAASPNLVEVTTVNGAEYVFIGSGAAGPGLGIMFIEANGTGSKITFKYTEESGTTTIYSTDSPSVIEGRINAATPTPYTGATIYEHTITFDTDALKLAYSNPITLINAPSNIHQAIEILSASYKFFSGSVEYNFTPGGVAFIKSSLAAFGSANLFWMDLDLLNAPLTVGSSGYLVQNVDQAQTGSNNESLFAWDKIVFQTSSDATQGDGEFRLFLTYRYINYN